MQYSNDLILLLTESLQNMENNGAGGSGSKPKGKKKKPQKGEPSLSQMRKSQESIKGQLENMIKQMKEGNGKNGKPSSKQLSQMLSQQEIFQQSLNQLNNGEGVGEEVSKQLKEINKLIEQNKRDIINEQIGSQLINRQQQIVTRLLQAENSKMERDIEKKRESKEAINYKKSNPDGIFDQDNELIIFDDILNHSNTKLNYFFRNKYHNYIINLN